MRIRRLDPEALFAGRFRIKRLIGQGSMGAVYLAVDEPTSALAAVKVMSADLADDRGFVARFVREAEIGRSIASEHVVKVLGSGVDEARAMPWIAMEYLTGTDLGRWLEARPSLGRADAAGLVGQLFSAIGAAHDARVVHRDLRPENIFVTVRDGWLFLKVLDFGVAKVVRETTLGGTAPGLGTPLWAAPEQGAAGSITPSADVWALGLLTFRALTGTMFWKGVRDHASPLDLAVELLRAPIPLASTRALELGVTHPLPAGFDAWFARAVTRDPAARFPDARAAWAALWPLVTRS